MIKCVKCHELLGENVTRCPFCNYSFTEEELSEHREEQERIHLETEQKSMKEHAKRLIIQYVVVFLVIAILLIGMKLLEDYNMDPIITQFIGAGMCFTCAIIYGVAALVFHIGKCPYCEQSMGRHVLFDKHCPRCGGKLKK